MLLQRGARRRGDDALAQGRDVDPGRGVDAHVDQPGQGQADGSGVAAEPGLDQGGGLAGGQYARPGDALDGAQHLDDALDPLLDLFGCRGGGNLDGQRAGQAVAPALDDAVQDQRAGQRQRGEEGHHRDDPRQGARRRIAIKRNVGADAEKGRGAHQAKAPSGISPPEVSLSRG